MPCEESWDCYIDALKSSDDVGGDEVTWREETNGVGGWWRRVDLLQAWVIKIELPQKDCHTSIKWTYVIFKYHKDSKIFLFVPKFTCFLKITLKWNEWHKQINFLTRKWCPFWS
jgi:hypothetical protein